MRDSNPQPSDP